MLFHFGSHWYWPGSAVTDTEKLKRIATCAAYVMLRKMTTAQRCHAGKRMAGGSSAGGSCKGDGSPNRTGGISGAGSIVASSGAICRGVVLST